MTATTQRDLRRADTLQRIVESARRLVTEHGEMSLRPLSRRTSTSGERAAVY